MLPLGALLQLAIERVRAVLDVQGCHASNMEEIWRTRMLLVCRQAVLR